MRDDDVSSHRTRSNRRPEPHDAPQALVSAIDDIFAEPLEDRT